MSRLHRRFPSAAAIALLALFPVLGFCQDQEARTKCLAAYRQAEALWARGKYREAIGPYETAVALAPQAFGARSRDTANMQNNLAMLYMHTGQYTRAEPLYLKSIRTREELLGKSHLLVAQGLNNLAELYRHTSRYAEAEPLYLRSLKIKEAKDPKNPSVAVTLNNLALLSKETGRYEQAVQYFRRGLKILEAGKPRPDLATTLDNLAQVYVLLGQDEKAEPLLQRSLRLFEDNLPKDHPDLAICLNSHAFLYHRQLGQLARAEPLYLRCLAIQEKRLGKDHPNVAQTLENLAVLRQDRGQFARAEELFLRSLKIRRDRLPADHPDLSQSLNDLGFLYLEMGKLDRAEPLLRESLKKTEAKFGPDHPVLTITLNNLGLLRLRAGHPRDAEALMKRSLKIRERLSAEHPEVAQSLNHLTQLYAAGRRWSEALAAADRGLRVLRRYASRVLSGLPEREQLSFLQTRVHGQIQTALSLGLARADAADAAELSATWVLNGKGLAQQTLAERSLLARDSRDEKLADVARELLTVRRRLAALTWQSPSSKEEETHRKRLTRLAKQEQELSRKLGQLAGRPLGDDPWVDLARVRRALPGDAVLVEMARFTPRRFQAAGIAGPRQAPRYAAWVIAHGKEKIQLVDLGPADKIDEAVKRFREAIKDASKQVADKSEQKAEKALREHLDVLSRLVLKPLLPHVGKSKKWLISPDGNLWLLPWEALTLADGKYAVEKYQISYLNSGRDLVSTVAVKAKKRAALVLADPDFDLDPDRARAETKRLAGKVDEQAMRSGALRLGRVGRLLGSAAEARAITPSLKAYAGTAPRVHLRSEALEAVFKAARNPRILVLSTHGFFLPDQAVPRDDKNGLGKAKSVEKWENPLLRCGLLLAGCNNASKAGNGDDGILTGLEVLEADLRGCELVVLSACETGVGEVQTGEGVSGLRQAFQKAGAQAVVSTLWQVDDKASSQLMNLFFRNLSKGMSKAEALCSAKRKLIEERRDDFAAAHPFFWAAFTLTGQ